MAFDIQKFLNVQVTEPMDTQLIPIPEGEYKALIKDIKPRMAKDSPILDVMWTLDDPAGAVSAATGLKENNARQSVFLDLLPNGGFDLAKGKNVQLGKLRDAVGQNIPGQPWMPGNLKGSVAKIKIGHRAAEDGSGNIFTDVKAVTKLS